MVDDSEALDAYSTAVVRVAESVLPSVASLRVKTRRGDGAGSASVLTTDGFLLTSAHVVEGSDALLVFDTRCHGGEARELLEETGLEIVPGRVLAIVPDTYGPDGEPTLNIFYLARVAGGTARPASDVSEIAWFGAGELPERAQIAFRCVRDVLERWRREDVSET